MTVFAFEGIDAALDLVPLAGRRALDRAGAKVGLAAWRSVPLAVRRALVAHGAVDQVDADAVRALLIGIEQTRVSAEPEPDADAPPEAVVLALSAVDPAAWASRSALERWSMASLARRGRLEALDALARELGIPVVSRPPPAG